MTATESSPCGKASRDTRLIAHLDSHITKSHGLDSQIYKYDAIPSSTSPLASPPTIPITHYKYITQPTYHVLLQFLPTTTPTTPSPFTPSPKRTHKSLFPTPLHERRHALHLGPRPSSTLHPNHTRRPRRPPQTAHAKYVAAAAARHVFAVSAAAVSYVWVD